MGLDGHPRDPAAARPDLAATGARARSPPQSASPGDSYFFAYENTRVISDIKADPKVGLSLQTKGGLLGKPPVFIAIEATAELIQDKAQFEAHWKDELERWFPQGIDTPGIVLIKAHANRVTYWDGEEEAEVKL